MLTVREPKRRREEVTCMADRCDFLCVSLLLSFLPFLSFFLLLILVLTIPTSSPFPPPSYPPFHPPSVKVATHQQYSPPQESLMELPAALSLTPLCRRGTEAGRGTGVGLQCQGILQPVLLWSSECWGLSLLGAPRGRDTWGGAGRICV